MSEWQPIESAPRDGSYMLLRFDGPFYDRECPGVAVGKPTDSGWWLTSIWAGSSAHRNPTHWMPLLPVGAA